MSCRICLVDHDPEIHRATLEIHAWFRDYVLLFCRAAEAARPINAARRRTTNQERRVREGLGVRQKMPPSY